jgi:hypothetical protein
LYWDDPLVKLHGSLTPVEAQIRSQGHLITFENLLVLAVYLAGWAALWYLILQGAEGLSKRRHRRREITVAMVLGTIVCVPGVFLTDIYGIITPGFIGFLVLSARHWRPLIRTWRAPART